MNAACRSRASAGRYSATGRKRRHDRCRVQLWRVLTMTVVSAGLYLLYWFYLTWRLYRDSTGMKAYPVWHALTLFVPIYSLFRTHAHMRVYSEAMSAQNLCDDHLPRMGRRCSLRFIHLAVCWRMEWAQYAIGGAGECGSGVGFGDHCRFAARLGAEHSQSLLESRTRQLRFSPVRRC